MKKKLRVAILFGGKSAEHEVSLQSAKNVLNALDKSKYEPVLIGIDREGRWYLNDEAQFLLYTENPRLQKLNSGGEGLALIPGEAQRHLVTLSGNDAIGSIDVVFPVLHGPFGEDGTVQGLLKLAGLPFVGAGVLGSAVGMDKDMMKRLLREAGIPVAPFISFNWPEEKNIDVNIIIEKLGLPCFIKPANLGSSVGIHKAHDEKEFYAAVKDAFRYDSKILVEGYIKGREIECSVLGNENPQASLPGEIIASHEFYDYEAKYIDENGARLEIPARLTAQQTARVQELAIASFKALDCAGMARVDFFLRESGEVVVNELNTIPGFTKISMYPKMWEASGVSHSELVDRLIQLALERHQREWKLKTIHD